MPRNGSGTYSLPAGNPVVTGTTISSTVHNNTMTDIGSEITNSLDKDGQTVVAGTIDFNANKIVLDGDGDTSIHASTDDVIDVEIGGADAIKLGWQSVADTGFVTVDPNAFTADATENTHRLAVLNTNAITVPTGTTALASSVYITEPNITATGTVTEAATVYIAGAPTEGASNYSLFVDAGNVRLDGELDVTGTTNLDVVDIDGAVDIATTALVTGVLTTTATQVATGGITSGSDIISDTDSTDSLGSTAVRWLKGWFDTLTAGTLTIGSGSVTDSSGAISFGNENLSTTGTLASGNLDVTGTLDVSSTLEASEKIRLGNNQLLQARNQADTQWRSVLKVDTNNDLIIGSSSTPITLDVDTTVTGGLRVSGDQATPLTNEGLYGGHATRGAYIQGHGSANDFTVANQAGTIAIAVPQNTINVEARGNLDVTGLFGLGARQSVTIASGAITATSSIIRIDTQGAASTDNLDTINGSAAGRIIIVHTTSSARDVVLKNGTGNLALIGGDVTLGTSTERLLLLSDGSNWIQVAPKSA